MPFTLIQQPLPVLVGTQQSTIQDDATLTLDGYSDVSGFGSAVVTLAVNIVDAPTGGSPTIQFTVQQLDPVDLDTPIGDPALSSVISVAGDELVSLQATASDTIRVSWALTGTTPSFTGVYVSLIDKGAGASGFSPAVDGSNRLIAVGAGAAGTPLGGVLSVQGVSGGIGLEVTGTGTAGTPAAGVISVQGLAGGTVLGVDLESWFGSTAPTVGQKTGTASLPVVVASDQSTLEVDGPGTAGTPSGGVLTVQGAAGVTALEVDLESWLGSTAPTVGQKAMAASVPTVIASDQTTLPVDGTGTAGTPAGGVLTVQGIAGATALEVDIESWLGSTVPTVGQKAMVASVPTVIASDQTTLPMDGTGTAGTPAGGVLTVQGIAGATALEVDLESWLGSTAPTVGQKAMAASVPTVIASDQTTLPVDGTGTAGTPAGGVLTVQGVAGATALEVDIESWLGSTAPTVGQKTMVASVPAVIASDQSAVNVRGPDAVGGAPTEAPVRMGGTDLSGSPVIRPVNVDTHGCLNVAGFNAIGDAPVDNPVETGGIDPDGLIRAFLTDVAGSLTVVGPDADGYASTASSVQMAGRDGTLVRPLTVDALGQPVVVGSGVAGAQAGGVLTVQGDAAGTLLPVELSTWMGSAAPTVGQKAMASSLPVVVASDQTILEVDGSGTAGTPAGGVLTIQGVSGATAVEVNLESWLGSTAPTVGQKAMAASVPTVIASDQSTLPVDGTGTSGTPAGGVLTVQGISGATAQEVNIESWLGATTPTVGQKTMAASVPAVIASDQSAVNVKGTDAVGAAPTENPIRCGGTDIAGGVIRPMNVDSHGCLNVSGFNAPGVAPVDYPVQMGGVDGGGLIREMLTDTAGNTNVVGPDADAAASTSKPVQTGGTDDGGITRAARMTQEGRAQYGYQIEWPTFVVWANDVSMGLNKSLISLQNATGSGVVLRLVQIYWQSNAIIAIPGDEVLADLRRVTSHSGGTDLTSGIVEFDTADTPVDALVTARTNAAIVVGPDATLKEMVLTNEEVRIGQGNWAEMQAVAFQKGILPQMPGRKAYTINENECIHLVCTLKERAGSVDIGFEFEQRVF